MLWKQSYDGSSVLMPAQRVYMGADRGGKFPHCFEATSNGCAAARTEETAIKRSINELVERDAFVRMWYSGESRPKISLDNFPHVKELKENRLESEHLSLDLLKMKSGLPVFAVGCVAHDRRERTPKFVIGTAAAPRKEDALIEALIEAVQG